jgi:hypothetical protein
MELQILVIQKRPRARLGSSIGIGEILGGYARARSKRPVHGAGSLPSRPTCLSTGRFAPTSEAIRSGWAIGQVASPQRRFLALH